MLQALKDTVEGYELPVAEHMQLRWKDQLGANPNPPRQHSLWEETRVPGENSRLSVER